MWVFIHQLSILKSNYQFIIPGGVFRQFFGRLLTAREDKVFFYDSMKMKTLRVQD